uniref:Uncharacterized protein n=1 Tax=Glossina austeni TaxID=7395 RepID=A0A1A9VWN4_GLOAU
MEYCDQCLRLRSYVYIASVLNMILRAVNNTKNQITDQKNRVVWASSVRPRKDHQLKYSLPRHHRRRHRHRHRHRHHPRDEILARHQGEIFGVGVSGVAKECITESCNTSDSSINERPTELRENSKSFFCDDFCEFSVSVKFVVRLLLSVCLNVNREALVRQHLPSESISKTRSSEDELSEQFCLKSFTDLPSTLDKSPPKIHCLPCTAKVNGLHFVKTIRDSRSCRVSKGLPSPKGSMRPLLTMYKSFWSFYDRIIGLFISSGAVGPRF